MPSQLDRILQQRINRRQFLALLGGGAISLLGISTILGTLAKNAPDNNPGLPGYGRQDYGP